MSCSEMQRWSNKTVKVMLVIYNGCDQPRLPAKTGLALAKCRRDSKSTYKYFYSSHTVHENIKHAAEA